MSRLTPVTREELVQRLRRLGFDGPFTGGSHQFVVRGALRLILPNPHRREIGVDLLVRVLRQAGVSREDWDESA
jgi:predicted RNA binding protein YcfA (HicA-like mRNA interferase family)